MAGAFDDYQPPNGGAFGDYQPPASSAAAAPTSPAPPAAPQSSQGWSDYLLDHLHRASVGLNTATRAATDWPTFGLVDKLFSNLPRPQQPQTVANLVKSQITGQPATGNPYSPTGDPQADTAQAHRDLGWANIPISLVGGLATGGPELAGARAIGGAIAPTLAKLPFTGAGEWLGGVLGSGVVGGGTGALNAYGHEAGWTPDVGDIEKGGAWGLGLGALGGVPGGVVGRGRSLPASPTAQAYFDQAKQAYKPLIQILYDGKQAVDPALDLATAKTAVGDLNGFKWKNEAPKTKTEIDNITGQAQLSADTIHTVQKNLEEIQGNPNANASDKLYAKHFSDQLQGVLENELPQTGVPQNLPPGVTPSNYAARVKAQGDFLTGQARDMERADVWSAVGATPAGKDIGAQAGQFVADQAARAAANKPGVWAPPGSPYSDASTALAKTTAKFDPISYFTKHALIYPAAFTAAGEGVNLATGGQGMGNQPWYARLGEELVSGGLAAMGLKGYARYSAAANAAEQQAAEAAVRQTIASRTMANPAGTYSPLRPSLPPTPFRDMTRALIFGSGF